MERGKIVFENGREDWLEKDKSTRYVPPLPPEFKNAKEVAERLVRIEMGGPSGLTLPALVMLAREFLELHGLVNTPEIVEFSKAIVLESAHQRQRWNDEAKTDADWFWLIGYLAGKALHNPHKSDMSPKESRLHRIVTIGAAANNWHAAVLREQA